ncbi:MAG: DUF4388 domain-containing protein [Thermoanaerobaculia bacterium]|nr:DUF4388 domain-containing protein [Thermoanaerobaculia bacterium]
MAIEGTLDVFQLPEILQVIAQQRKTGILTVQGPDDIVAVSFLDGRVVAADALNETADEGLGEVLVEEGLIDRETLRRLRSRLLAGEERLADLVVSGGHLDRRQLLGALRRRTQRLLFELFEWRKGEYKFYGGDEVSFEDGFEPIGVDEVLLHASDFAPGPPPAAVPALFEEALSPAEPVEERPSPAVVLPAEREERRPTIRLAPSPVLAGALGIALAVAAFRNPAAWLLPFPWLGREQAALVRERQAAALLEVDRAAKTHYLSVGQFPARLDELVERGLLSASDLEDPEGRRLRYVAETESYSLSAGDGDLEVREGIGGNFLLDPTFQKKQGPTGGKPIVLLD